MFKRIIFNKSSFFCNYYGCNVRIGQYTGNDTGGRQRESDSEQRRHSFRRRHALGQEVEGVLCENSDAGFAWVNVGGLDLFAKVPFEARPGQRLLLRIMQLEPEIILKFIRQLHARTDAIQVQAYTASRNSCELAWQTFLHSELIDNVTFQTTTSAPAEKFQKPELGEPLPENYVKAGEYQVDLLHGLFQDKFLKLNQDAAKMYTELDNIQHAHINAAHSTESGVCAWAHIPWSGISGREKEFLIVKKKGHKLDEVFMSGIWPELGGVMVAALGLDGKISCRISAQNMLPFEQTVQILNLAGLGAVLRHVKQAFGLRPWPETLSLTCLDYRQQPPDSVAAILLRLQQ